MRKPGLKQRGVWISATIIVGLLVLSSGLIGPLTGPLTSALAKIAAPLHSAGVRFRNAVGTLSHCRDTGETGGLAADLEALKIENAKLTDLAAENSLLKAALGYGSRFKDRSVTAKVISETDDGYSRLLIIDRGAQDGVSIGRPVIAGDGLIVGKVVAVRSRTASVMPLTDSTSRLAVTVQNATETVGVLEGDRGLSMHISLIPQMEELTPGETVITSGLEPGVRRGFVVGVLDKIDRPAQEPFQRAAVRAFDSVSHPYFVQVILETN